MTDRQKAALHLGWFMAAFLVAWTFRATSLYVIDEAIASPTLRAVYSNLLKLLLWVLPAAAFVYWLKGLPPTDYWAMSSFPRRNQWKLCLFATAAFLFAVATFALSVASKSISFAPLASTPLILGLLSFVVSPVLEELLFRGFVLKELLSLLPLAFANALTSLLFVAVHVPYWLSHGGLAHTMMVNCAGVFFFSLLAGWLYAKSGSFWPPTLAHIANNILSSLLIVRTV
jgi:membrane protease YdiL (CAAX protease family)